MCKDFSRILLCITVCILVVQFPPLVFLLFFQSTVPTSKLERAYPESAGRGVNTVTGVYILIENNLIFKVAHCAVCGSFKFFFL